MLISSFDRESFIQLDPCGQEGLPVVEVTACVSTEVVCNERVVLVRLSQTLRELEAFERSWSGGVALQGSEEFLLTLGPDGGNGDLWISLRVTRVLTTHSPRTGRAHSGKHLLEGGFSVPGSRVTSLFRDLRSMILPLPAPHA